MPRRSRRGRWAAGIVLFLVIGLAASLYWRQPLAGAVLRAALGWAGFPGAELSVSDLSLSKARLTGVRLGRELAIRTADIDYDLSRLSDNPFTLFALDGVRIDLTGAGGPLRRRIEARPADSAPMSLRMLIERAAGLPAVAVKDLSLRVAPAGATVTLAGAAHGRPEAGGAYAIEFDLRLAGDLAGEARAVALAGRARAGKNALDFETTAKTADGSSSGSLALRADIASGAALVGGGGRVKMRDPGSLGGLVPFLEGAGGDVEIAARTTKPASVGLDAPLGPFGPGAALRTLAAGGIDLDAAIEDGSHPAGFEGVDAKLALTIRGDSAAVDGLLANGRLSLQARQIAAPGVTVEQADIAGPFRIARQDDTVTLALPQPMKIAAADIRVRDGTAGLSPVAMMLSGGRTHALRLGLVQDGTVDARLRLDVGAAAVRPPGPSNGELRIAPFTLRLAGTADRKGAMNAAIQVRKISATQGGRTGIVDDLAMTVKRSGASSTASLRGRVSALAAGVPLLHPVLVQSDLSLWRDILTFDAKAILPGLSVATAKGRADLFAGTGSAALALPSFRVTPGGGEFRALAPSLAGFDVRSGTLRASADLTWDEKGVDGAAAIGVADMNLSHGTGGTTIQGLNVDIRFDRLASPRTPPGQTVRAKKIEAGMAFDAPALRFALVDGTAPGTPAVKIEAFDAGFAGGRLSIAPTVLDSAAGAGEAAVALDKVDLAALLGAIGLDGVSGVGRLSGVVPVRLAGKAVVVRGGRLAAEGPGVLRIRSEAAKAALAGGGADVALMLSALEDFRYEALTLEIEKEEAGEGRVMLRTKGSNPAVRDGQPFAINLGVSGNVDRLAAVVAQALLLPGELVRSMLPQQP